MDIAIVIAASLAAAVIVVLVPRRASAHCDTLDGPAVRDGRAALATGNVNHALKWVRAEDEAQVRQAFELSVRVRHLGPDARELADRFFLETLVRIHRAGEGEGFEGLKPSGTVLDPRVVAADAAIDGGELAPLLALVPPEDAAELSKRFDRAMALRTFDVDDLVASRAFVAAYVDFFKFAEGEEHHHGHGAHGKEAHQHAAHHDEAHHHAALHAAHGAAQ